MAEWLLIDGNQRITTALGVERIPKKKYGLNGGGEERENWEIQNIRTTQREARVNWRYAVDGIYDGKRDSFPSKRIFFFLF